MIEETQVIECTTDTLIRDHGGLIYALQLTVDGVTAGDTVVIRDGDAGGTIIWRIVAHATDYVYTYTPSNPIRCNDGIHVDMTLASGNAYLTVQYS